MSVELANLENHIVLIGADKFAQLVTGELLKAERQVVLIANDAATVERLQANMPREGLVIMQADYQNLEAIKQAGLERCAVAFINLPNDREKLIFIFNLRKQFPKLKIVSPVSNPNLKESFIKQDNTYPLSKDEISAKIMSSHLFERDVATYLNALLSPAQHAHDHDIQQYRVIGGNPYCNKHYGEAFTHLKQTHNAILIGLSKRQGEEYRLLKNPPDDTLIEEQDYLVMIVSGSAAQAIAEQFGVQDGL